MNFAGVSVTWLLRGLLSLLILAAARPAPTPDSGCCAACSHPGFRPLRGLHPGLVRVDP